MIDNQYSYYQMYSVGGIENIGPGYKESKKSLVTIKLSRIFCFGIEKISYFCNVGLTDGFSQPCLSDFFSWCTGIWCREIIFLQWSLCEMLSEANVN